ncbi:metal ABC transporter solute-binding protein, Zn/Mn family [Tengunoibacter tsumagoiensis]|uniref:ABC transporter substrate-binding protein n=1 Tax=Tengunoibacter tsumagoiensis TaxID=2014871 RepID=A0A402A5Q9_9CHLR|nr:zinc ABC transporter substrate-binding protein [Tengunoibacter tsumagoiensis]GCE14419.1 ABC transporter substrate-binding protein [Tengunoibacter tsumagoiensis]
MPWLKNVLFVLVGMAVLGSMLGACGPASSSASSGIKVVAAENFYGDIVKQLGGAHVSVTSILSDPNVDPHEFESNFNNAKAVGNARLIVANGGGYDNWIDKLLSSAPKAERSVIKGSDLALPQKLPDNEHIWYDVDNMDVIAEKVTEQLITLDPAHTSDFSTNLQTFKQSLQAIHQKMDEIKARYAGTPIGLTETIYLYQAQPMGLKIMTPFAFEKAMAEGNDPPADSVVTTDNQVKQKQIKVLIYNVQTTSNVTTKLQDDAKAQHLPVVAVSETMPTTKTYQTWMLDQLNALEAALAK